MTAYEILPDSTRVWIYQANKPFSEEDIPQIQQYITNFTTNWVSHNNQLKAYGNIYHRQFIVLMVDESQSGASGCSIDKSVHFIKQLEQHYSVDLFDRLVFTYVDGEEIKTASRDEFAALYKEGHINNHTMVFDNLVKNKEAFKKEWLKPLGKSWHKRMV